MTAIHDDLELRNYLSTYGLASLLTCHGPEKLNIGAHFELSIGRGKVLKKTWKRKNTIWKRMQ